MKRPIVALVLLSSLGAAHAQSGICSRTDVFSIELRKPYWPKSGFMFLSEVNSASWRVPAIFKHRLLGNLALHPGDTDQNLKRSTAILCEDDKELGPAHSGAKDIIEKGGGRFQHWHSAGIFFSSSDGTDPNKNGRRYRAVEP
jgi:hypothetical protein